jgi:cytochrome c biogenesis protein CcdA
VTPEFVGGIVAMAAVDALNPSTVVGCAYLLSTPQPTKRVAAFIAAIACVYYSMGAVVLIGLGERATDLTDAVHGGQGRRIVGAVIGCIMIALALRRWVHPTRPAPTRIASLRSMRPLAAFSLGATMTLVDLTTAAPYVAALGSIARCDAMTPAQLLVLAMYNVIYLTPTLVLVLAWFRFGSRGVARVELVRRRYSQLMADRRWSFVLASMGVVLIAYSVLS